MATKNVKTYLAKVTWNAQKPSLNGAKNENPLKCILAFFALHLGDFTQPQQKYAGTGENCNIAIAVIFYPEIKTL